MRATGPLLRHSSQGFLRLGELHQRLFQEPQPREHDALADAYAAARCFFEMRRQGIHHRRNHAPARPVRWACSSP